MTKRAENILDKIGKLIPGFNGYSIRDEKRDLDKKLRIAISAQLNQIENEIIIVQRNLILKNDLTYAKELDVIRKKLNTLSNKIKNVHHGQTAFFNNNEIKENELDRIYAIDLNIAQVVSSLSPLVKENVGIDYFKYKLHELEDLLLKRLDFINSF